MITTHTTSVFSPIVEDFDACTAFSTFDPSVLLNSPSIKSSPSSTNSMGCLLAISDRVGMLRFQFGRRPPGSDALLCFVLVLPSTGGGGSGALRFFNAEGGGGTHRVSFTAALNSPH